MLRSLICLCLVWGAVLLGPQSARAQDVRVALLMAHQHGWKKDPFLRYVIKGDLLPLARLLRGIGFQVKLLQNPTPAQVRRALKWARQRVRHTPRVDTFLFYYSGHADRKQLHLGPKTKAPVTYKSLVRFLRKLPVRRRIALLDACFSGEIIREFGSIKAYNQLVRKGARGIRPLDLTRAFPNQGEQSGLQVMSSSLNTSWESKKYKASVFTHFALKGLRGRADRNRDGKISVDELFDYVSDSMAKEIRQKPIMFGVVRRTRAYALAPAYHSRLWIGPQIVGTVRVSVANFFWSRKKQSRQPIRLAVVHGYGRVEVQHKGTCLRQQVYLPKGRMARLRDRWKRVSCKKRMRVSKGMIELPTQLYIPPPRSRDWSLSFQGGLNQSFALGGALLGGGQITLWHRFFGISLGGWGSSLQFQDGGADQMMLQLRVAGGYRLGARYFDWFIGGYAGATMLFQDLNKADGQTGLLPQLGALTSLTWWAWRDFGIELHADAGMSVTRIGGELRPFFHWAATLGLRWLL